MGKVAGWVAGHRKAIAAFLSALGGVCAFVAAQQDWGPAAKYAGIVVLVLGAAGVYRVPNADGKPADNKPGALRAPPGWRQHR